MVKKKSSTKKVLRKKTGKRKAAGTLLSWDRMERVVEFFDEQPFEVLGPHVLGRRTQTAINAYLPRAKEAWIRVVGTKDRIQRMRKLHPGGFYQALVHGKNGSPRYKIGFMDEAGYSSGFDDPYAYPTQLSDYDLYLIAEGTHYKSYEKLGAHVVSVGGVSGVHFAVWAPNAKSVSVIGNFNHWHSGEHPMTRLGTSGIWALFIPALKAGEIYKYAIRSQVDDEIRVKADPYAFQAELRPRSASVVASLNRYKWHDADWVARRSQFDFKTAPISVYEVHLGSWRRTGPNGIAFLSYRELARELVDYVKGMGYTHIELLPITEHPLDQSWGYQVVGYYAPTSRFGSPEDFMYLVDQCHQNGIGVILDWVPSHFPKDGHGLAYFDGKQIYAYEGWKKGEHKDWDTFIFDYGRNEVRNFLISNALFWLDRYHLDGLRVDAVASMLYLDYSRKEGEWEPNQYGGRENLEAISFLKRFNEVVHLNHPGVITMAEESTAWAGVSRPTYLGGLGFSMKWNMGWMHDTLEYFSKDAVHRQHHQGTLTFSMLYAFTENFVLPLSHDEVVHGKGALIGKMPGDDWQRFAGLRLLFGYMYAHPGKKLLFMGDDLAQICEWDCTHSIEWHLLDYAPHKQLNQFVKDLNHLYRTHRAFHEIDFDSRGFEWIDFSDAPASIISFIRWSKDFEELLLVTCNMTPVPRTAYRFGVPKAGFYEELLNSDAREYGGSGIGNFGGVQAQPSLWQNRPFSVEVNLPPLAVNIYRWKEPK